MNPRKSVLVTGSHGQLGRSLTAIAEDYPNYHFTFSSRDEIDLSDLRSMGYYFQQHRFDVIINCAAYTAVDKAEQEPELAKRVNYLAVNQLAEIALRQKSLLIHISTDYVYNGENFKPYLETDPIDPQNVYGESKFKGELSIQAVAPQAIIIRTSWVYSEYGHNFVKTMCKLGQERDQLGIIFDQIGSPTYARDLASCILQLITLTDQSPPLLTHHRKAPVYHFSNEGVCSWYDFAKTIFELTHTSCKISPIETKDYPTPAKRPHYSVLNKSKIKQDYGIRIPHWKDSLSVCIKNLQKNKLK